MKTNTENLEPDKFYHIYNRGINGENLFKEERNYKHFFSKYAKYIEPLAETYAYCLLKNHFHLCIKTLSEIHIKDNLKALKTKELTEKMESHKIENALLKISEVDVSLILGNGFGNLFKSHAQSINLAYNRTGGLFEKQFRRIEIDNENYLRELICYINKNAQKHNFVKDFREYPHSSYAALLSDLPTRLKRDEVIQLFGSKSDFEKYHLGSQNLRDLEIFKIEME